MPKHTNPSADLRPLTGVIANILDLRSVRDADLDGHLYVDAVEPEVGLISGRVLHAHDDSVLVNFSVQLAVS